MSTKELNAAIMKLPAKKRAELAERLLASLDDDAQRTVDAQWAAEAEARIDALDSGKMNSEPSSKIVRKLRKRKRG